jgi:hypothetical protein
MSFISDIMSEFELDLFIDNMDYAHDHAEGMNPGYQPLDEWNFPVTHWDSVVSYHLFTDSDVPF